MNRLKELRKEKGLSQKAFSKETGVPLRTLQSWENGESQIKPEKAQQLADYFGVSVGYLLGYDKPKDNITDQFASELFGYLTVEEKEKILSDPLEQQYYLSVAFERMQNINEISEKEINSHISAFNNDFIDFLKRHELYLSDTEIKKVIDILYSYSNANQFYLSSLLKNQNFKELHLQKEKYFTNLFKYSTLWEMNYEGLRKTVQSPTTPDNSPHRQGGHGV